MARSAQLPAGAPVVDVTVGIVGIGSGPVVEGTVIGDDVVGAARPGTAEPVEHEARATAMIIPIAPQAMVERGYFCLRSTL
jgi:hypothetical protein